MLKDACDAYLWAFHRVAPGWAFLAGILLAKGHNIAWLCLALAFANQVMLLRKHERLEIWWRWFNERVGVHLDVDRD